MSNSIIVSATFSDKHSEQLCFKSFVDVMTWYDTCSKQVSCSLIQFVVTQITNYSDEKSI